MGAAVIPALIGAAVSVGGSLVQSKAQSAAVEAQNRAQQQAMQRQQQARQQEYARQETLRKQQQGLMDESLAGQDGNSVTNQLEQVKADRSEAPVALSQEMAALTPGDAAIAARPGQGGDVQIVNDDLGARIAQAAQKTRGYLQAKSDIGAYGQLFGDRARTLGMTNENLNFINKKRGGSLDTSAIETGALGQDFASSIAPNSMGMALGSAISGLGQMLGKGAAGKYSGGYG
jgi:hypothetical protein